MRKWISEEVLEWFATNGGGSVLDESKVYRAYELLARAETFLNKDDPTDDDFSDCIGSLRRCLTQRNRFIEEAYNLRQVLASGNRKHYLELLSDFNVVRPTLLKDLLEFEMGLSTMTRHRRILTHAGD